MSRRQVEKNRRQADADSDAMELRDSSTGNVAKERKRLRPLRQSIDNDLEGIAARTRSSNHGLAVLHKNASLGPRARSKDAVIAEMTCR